MATQYTQLLGLALPVTGELSGTWGDVVNNEITSLAEAAIAGTTSVNITSGDVTLTDTDGAANQSRAAILIATGTPGTSRNIVAPSQSKVYIVINKSDSSVVVKGTATTGVSVSAGKTSVVAWDGSDYVLISDASSLNTALVTLSGVQTLTNKTISDGVFTNGYTEETTTTTAGAAYTVSLSDGTVFILTLNAGCTFTFPSPSPGKSFLVQLKQDAVGSRTVTWPASVLWPSGVTPTITTLANKTDIVAFSSDGNYWYGRVIGLNY